MKGDRKKVLLFVGSALAAALLLSAIVPDAGAVTPPAARSADASGRFARPR